MFSFSFFSLFLLLLSNASFSLNVPVLVHLNDKIAESKGVFILMAGRCLVSDRYCVFVYVYRTVKLSAEI